MVSPLSRFARSMFAFAVVLASTASGRAQATASATEIPDSRVDVYGGYGYFHPINSGINGYQYTELYNPNATVAVTGFFNRYVGVQLEGAYFTGPRSPQSNAACPGCSDLKYYTAQAGPVLRLPLGRWVPYIHAIGGGARYNGPAQQPLRWGWGVTGGAGIDYVLPFAHDLIAIRPIQADFQYSQVVYGPLVLPAGVKGGFGEIDAVKLSGGLVLRFGELVPKQPPMLGCTTEPATVHPGEPVRVHGASLNLNPKLKAFYTWTATGGHVMPNDADATIETGGLAPGEYVVTGSVRERMNGKERANCTAPFIVKPYDPPTISCTAAPAAVLTGATVDISTVGTSPQNRPLTYSYSASAGLITSTGTTAQLATDGVPPQNITITCNVVDDVGHSARSTTMVAVNAPPPPPPAVVAAASTPRPLCSLSFERDRARPVRVDNESKACLDDIALTLNKESTASLVIVGNTGNHERPEAAAQRALNIRQYLTREKGIDPSRIQLRTGSTSGRTATTQLLPQGSTFVEGVTRSFDEKSIRRRGQAYGTPHALGTPPVHRTARKPLPATKPAAPIPPPPASAPAAKGSAPAKVPAKPAPAPANTAPATKPAAKPATPTPAADTAKPTAAKPTTATPATATPPAKKPTSDPKQK